MAVYDGHGGGRASAFLGERLHKMIDSSEHLAGGDVATAFKTGVITHLGASYCLFSVFSLAATSATSSLSSVSLSPVSLSRSLLCACYATYATWELCAAFDEAEQCWMTRANTNNYPDGTTATTIVISNSPTGATLYVANVGDTEGKNTSSY